MHVTLFGSSEIIENLKIYHFSPIFKCNNLFGIDNQGAVLRIIEFTNYNRDFDYYLKIIFMLKSIKLDFNLVLN